MTGRVRALLTTGITTVALLLGLPATGAAAATGAPGSPATVGYDVSHPQCDEDLPGAHAFGVVGVNGGVATTANPCLAEQLRWAARAPGGVGEDGGQPRVQLYVNTANPGQQRHRVSTWPVAWSTPYGPCDAGNTVACSWQYGWERARETVNEVFAPAAEAAGVDPDPAGYTWWLDVETANTWQSGSAAAQARNRAALEGMAAYIVARGGQPGLYALPSQWRRIAGAVTPDSPLYRLDSWLAGAGSAAAADAACDRPPLVDGGRVVLVQYVRGGLDRDLACG
jgi:hypothetical protein